METLCPKITASAASPESKHKDHDKSWYEMVLEEEEENRQFEAAGEHQETVEMSSQPLEEDNKSTAEEELVMSSLHKASKGRQIEIDILDSANVKKYEKLVKSDLIKSPFKRRLSGDLSSDEVEADEPPAMEGDRGDGTEQPSHCKRIKKNENDHGVERLRRESSSSGTSSHTSRKQVEYETDEIVLARRQKQIDYGKNTLGYENYIKQVPRHTRTIEQPGTPQKHIKYSRRAWDGLIRVWRKKLHCYDPNSKSEEDE